MTGTINTSTGAANTAVLGIGSYRPRTVVPNSVILEQIDSSDEWIQTRSGIKERRWAEADETVLMMSVEAAKQALADSGVDPAQIGCVIVEATGDWAYGEERYSRILREKERLPDDARSLRDRGRAESSGSGTVRRCGHGRRLRVFRGEHEYGLWSGRRDLAIHVRGGPYPRGCQSWRRR